MFEISEMLVWAVGSFTAGMGFVLFVQWVAKEASEKESTKAANETKHFMYANYPTLQTFHMELNKKKD